MRVLSFIFAILLAHAALSSLAPYRDRRTAAFFPEGVPAGLYLSAGLAVDLNNDGYDDLFASGSNSAEFTQVYYFNASSSSYYAAYDAAHFLTYRPPAVRYSAAAYGDLNGDGKTDLVYMGRNGCCATYFAYHVQTETDGVFEWGVTSEYFDAIPGGLYQGTIAVGDLNDDGRDDVIISGITGGGTKTFYMYFQTENGTLANAVSGSTFPAGVPQGIQLGKVQIGDLNHDGLNDFISTGEGTGSFRIDIFTQGPAGVFNRIDYTPAFPDGIPSGLYRSCAAIGDFNNDTMNDLVVMGMTASGTVNALSYFWFQESPGVFRNARTAGNFPLGLPSPLGYSSCTAADVNRDGRMDFIQQGSPQSGPAVTELFLQSENGTLRKGFPAELFPDGVGPGVSSGSVSVSSAELPTLFITGDSASGLSFAVVKATCSPGFAATKDRCLVCGEGEYADVDTSSCALCPSTSIAISNTSTSCMACPSGEMADPTRVECVRIDGSSTTTSGSPDGPTGSSSAASETHWMLSTLL